MEDLPSNFRINFIDQIAKAMRVSGYLFEIASVKSGSVLVSLVIFPDRKIALSRQGSISD